MTPGRPFSSYKALAGLIVAIILLVGGGYLLYNHHKTTNKPSTNTSATGTTSHKLVIKDFGVEIVLPQSLVGTTAETTKSDASSKITPPPSVNLILDKYSNEVSGCLELKYDYKTPYASLIKLNGTAPSGTPQVMKQFDSFYIQRLGSGLQLSCKDPSMQTTFDEMTQKYNQDLKEAFSSAEKIN